MRVCIVRLQPQRFVVMVNRFVKSFLLDQCNTEIDACLGIAGVDGERAPIAGNSFVQPVKVFQRHCKIVVSSGVIGPDSQRLMVTGDGFFVPVLLGQHDAEVIVRLDVTGTQPDGFPIALFRVFVMPKRMQRVSEVVVQLGHAGIEPQGVTVAVRCFAVTPEFFERRAEIAPRFQEIRLKRDRALQALDRLLGFSRFQIERAELVVAHCEPGLHGDGLLVGSGGGVVVAKLLVDCSVHQPQPGVGLLASAHIREQVLRFDQLVLFEQLSESQFFRLDRSVGMFGHFSLGCRGCCGSILPNIQSLPDMPGFGILGHPHGN